MPDIKSIGDRIEWGMIKHRRLLVVLLIVVIGVLDIFFGVTMYNNMGYPTATKLRFNIEFYNLIDRHNETVKLFYDLTIASSGPLAANNEIKPKEVGFCWFAKEYIKSVNFSYIELRFELHNADTPTPYDSDYTWDVVVNVTEAYLYGVNTWLVLDETNTKGSFSSLNAGNMRIDGIAVTVLNGTQYVGNISDNLVFGNEPTTNTFYVESAREYSDYQNNRYTLVSIVVAAITFSIPATVKVISELYWGKNNEKS